MAVAGAAVGVGRVRQARERALEVEEEYTDKNRQSVDLKKKRVFPRYL